ncbi:MAG: citrate/2-methylcitrate synthase [Alphaproteobacteria bacterium]|nr:citrate/2-methylcitrate synthase [Alphaproteobacteria bacterium]
MSDLPTIYRGLSGIYVDSTAISKVDGENGVLTYRGESIEVLAKRDFIEVCYLVLFDDYPSDEEKSSFNQFLIEHSNISKAEEKTLRSLSQNLHPMKMLQGMVPLLELKTQIKHNYEPEMADGLIIAAKVPALLAAYHQICVGKPIIPATKNLSFHANFLHRFTGKLPHDKQVAILDVTQILQMEHSFNASTYAALVTASTLAPVECAISTGFGTLFGKLHGGADQAALEMAMGITDIADVEEFVVTSLKNKQKIMGMGHRVYKVVDPRAKILKPMARELCLGTPFEKTYLILEEIERVMGVEMNKKGKDIKANVEFYKGPVFYALGIPANYFTALFAMSRVFGYLAHILASRADNMLIRPKAYYIGK